MFVNHRSSKHLYKFFKMDENRSFKRIFIWFIIFDQNHLESTFGIISRSARIVYTNLKIVYIVLYMTSIIEPFQIIFRSDSASLDIARILNDIVPLILIQNLTEIFESWVYSEALAIVTNTIKESIHYLNTFINMKNHISAFASRFRKNLLIFIMLFLIEFYSKITSRSTFVTSYSKVWVIIAALYKHFAVLHIILFIDTQTLILSSLNHHLNPVCDDSINDCFILYTSSSMSFMALRRIKTVYSNLRTISDNVNKRFGCFLVVMFMNIVIFAIQTGVSFYLTLISSNNTLEILRK